MKLIVSSGGEGKILSGTDAVQKMCPGSMKQLIFTAGEIIRGLSSDMHPAYLFTLSKPTRREGKVPYEDW